MPYVVYSSDEEVILSTPEDEHLVIQEYFIEGGRSLEDYDRTVSTGPVTVKPKLQAGNY